MWSFLKRVWNSSLANKATLIGGALIFAIAIGALIYAFIVRPGDLAFIKRNGNQLEWPKDRLPLLCFYDPKLPNEWVDAIGSAVKKIEKEIGIYTFAECLPWTESIPKKPPEGAMLLAPRNEDLEEIKGASTYLNYDKSYKMIGVIILFDSGFNLKKTDKKILLRVALHELGHVLLLDHDREQDSLMHSSNLRDAKSFTNKDIKALRQKYRNNASEAMAN